MEHDEDALLQHAKTNKTIKPESRGISCATVDQTDKWCCWYPRGDCNHCDPNGCEAFGNRCYDDNADAMCHGPPKPDPPGPPVSCTQPEACKNNGGANINQGAIWTDSPQACMEECKNHADCFGYTFVRKNPNECWLKRWVNDMQGDDCSVYSGTCDRSDPGPGPPSPTPPGPPGPGPASCGAWRTGWNNHGHNMGESHGKTSAGMCEAQCKFREGCKGWTFIPNRISDGHSNDCYLKDSVGEWTYETDTEYQKYLVSGNCRE